MQPLTLTGARTLISWNGANFAAGVVVNYNLDYGLVETSGIDNVLPDEISPNRIGVSLTVQVYRTPENDPEILGISPPAGKNQTPQENFAGTAYVSLELRDRVTDKTILYVPRAMLGSRSGAVQAQDFLMETWQLRGIGFRGPTQKGLVGNIADALGIKGVVPGNLPF